MDTPRIENTIANLQNRLVIYDPKMSNATFGLNSKLAFFTPTRIYLIIPFVILILLYFSDLSFLYIEDNKGVKTYSYQRLFLFTISISFILIIAFFAYNYKKNNLN